MAIWLKSFKEVSKQILLEQTLLVIRILIGFSIFLTLVQLFTPISLSCQLTLFQLIVFPHVATSIFLWKIQLHNRREELIVGSSVGSITALFPVLLFLIIEILRFLSPEYREPFFVERGVTIPEDNTLLSVAFTVAFIFSSILMLAISAFSGYIAALFPIKYWFNKINP
jgi:hypothetical protein